MVSSAYLRLLIFLPAILIPACASSSPVFLIGKDSDAGRNWGQEEKGTTEDEMDGITNSMDMNYE